MRTASLFFTSSLLFTGIAIFGCAPREEAIPPAAELAVKADSGTTDAEPEEFHGNRVERYPAFVDQAWFPLVEGARYWYSGQFEGKIHQTEITVVKHATPWGHVFYFADAPQISDPSPLLSANMFGLAGYITTTSEVLTIQASYFEGFAHERSAYVQTLLRLPLIAGDATQVRDRGTTDEITVAGRERITVPAGTFDCIRIIIRDASEPHDGESSVWLAEGVGMVKWHRKTGRVDELTRYELPSRGDAPQ